MPYEFSPKAVKAAKRESEIFSHKEEERKKEVARATKQRQEDWQRQQLINEASSFTNQDKKQTVTHNRGKKTPAGDSLPHGPRGGRYDSGKGLAKLR